MAVYKNHIKQYKTLELRVADPEKHGYKNFRYCIK